MIFRAGSVPFCPKSNTCTAAKKSSGQRGQTGKALVLACVVLEAPGWVMDVLA
jgi:hypothetical protein